MTTIEDNNYIADDVDAKRVVMINFIIRILRVVINGHV